MTVTRADTKVWGVKKKKDVWQRKEYGDAGQRVQSNRKHRCDGLAGDHLFGNLFFH